MPDSIGSKDSPFDIGELIDNVWGQDAYFGAKRQEQSENKKHLKRLLKIEKRNTSR